MRSSLVTNSNKNYTVVACESGIGKAKATAIIAVIIILAAVGGYFAIANFGLLARSTSTTAQEKVTIILPQGVGQNSSLNFEPANVTVVIGVNNTIEWRDNDQTAQHTVTSTSVPDGAKMFDSSTLNGGNTYTLTLVVPGIYHYYCKYHPAWMIATIVAKT